MGGEDLQSTLDAQLFGNIEIRLLWLEISELPENMRFLFKHGCYTVMTQNRILEIKDLSREDARQEMLRFKLMDGEI